MSRSKYPNRDALRKAHDIYLEGVYPFVIKCLNKVQGETAEELIKKALNLSEGDDIQEKIEISDIAHLIIRLYWRDSFKKEFDAIDPYYEARSVVGLIVEGRNRASHPPWDVDTEFTRSQLFLIADILEKINRPNEQREVEAIRDELFFDDSAERLEKVEAHLADYKRSLTGTEERLAAAESEKSEYAEKNTALSVQVDEKEKQRKKLDRQLKNANGRNDKLKSDLSDAKKRLEQSEAAQTDYKKRLETTSKELEQAKAEKGELEKRLKTIITPSKTEKEAHEKRLQTVLKQLKTADAIKIELEERLEFTSDRLEDVEAELAVYKERLGCAIRQLEVVEAEKGECENSFDETEEHFFATEATEHFSPEEPGAQVLIGLEMEEIEDTVEEEDFPEIKVEETENKEALDKISNSQITKIFRARLRNWPWSRIASWSGQPLGIQELEDLRSTTYYQKRAKKYAEHRGIQMELLL